MATWSHDNKGARVAQSPAVLEIANENLLRLFCIIMSFQRGSRTSYPV